MGEGLGSQPRILQPAKVSPKNEDEKLSQLIILHFLASQLFSTFFFLNKFIN